MHTSFLNKILSVLIVALFVAFILRVFVIEGYVVQGDSMYPTLQNGDYVFIYKLAYARHDPQRGDVVVAVPRQYSLKVVKRIAVLPGEMFEPTPGKRDNLDPEEYFLVGDNMPVSVDSRTFGPVDRWDIKGKVIGGIRIKTLQIIHLN